MNPDTLKSKQEIVSEIEKNFEESNSLVIVDYRGLTVAQLSELRKSLKAVDASLSVYKNTLVSRANATKGNAELEQYLNGSNAFVFSKGVVDAPKVLAKFAKRNESLEIKAGLIEGRVVDADGVKDVAKLPDRNGLLSMFLSCLQAPVRSFACAVKAVADKQ